MMPAPPILLMGGGPILLMRGDPILLMGGGQPWPLLGLVAQLMARGKPHPGIRLPHPKRHRGASRGPDSFSAKNQRLMKKMKRSREGRDDGGTSRWGVQGQGGPKNFPMHPDSYSIRFRILLEGMGQVREIEAGPGRNFAVATSAANEDMSEMERKIDSKGGEEKVGRGGPIPLQNEEEEEREEGQDDDTELDWFASTVEELIGEELHQLQMQESPRMASPIAQPILAAYEVVPGPITAEPQSPDAWDGVKTSPVLKYLRFQGISMGPQFLSPPLSLGKNMDLGPDSPCDYSLLECSVYTDMFYSVPDTSKPSAQEVHGPNISSPDNTHLSCAGSHFES